MATENRLKIKSQLFVFNASLIMIIYDHHQVDLQVQHLFPIQNQKRNQETLIETGRNRPVSRNQTAILAGAFKSSLKVRGVAK